MVDRTELLNLTELRERGWTPAMVRRFLGKEDERRRNPFYRQAAPQRLYLRERVLALEGSMDFEAARATGACRAARAKAVAERKKTALLEELANLQIEVVQLDARRLHREAIQHYNNWHRDRDEYLHSPDAAMLDRITVNYIRHELTSYDGHLDELFGRIGKAAGIFAVREKVYAAIAAAYPYLAAECAAQLAARRPLTLDTPPAPKEPMAAQT